MLRVGLTGGVGSGKSKVADMLLELGARVSRSDEVGRAMMQPGRPMLQAIAAHFGPSVLTAGGSLDRQKLAQIAFEDGRVEELNAIVHPAVIAEQARWMDAVGREDPNAVAVIESALIFETRHGRSQSAGDTAPWRTRFDRIVLVTAPERQRRERYVARIADIAPLADAETAARDFDQRSRAQWSDERKTALSDVVLQNSGSLEDLRVKVAALFATLQQESLDRVREAM